MDFAGFAPDVRHTPVPNSFIAELLQQIDDIEELKATLQVMWALTRKRGQPRYVTYRELLGLRLKAGGDEDDLRRGLDLAVRRKTLLQVGAKWMGHLQQVYLLNTPRDREAVRLLQETDLKVEGVPPGEAAAAEDSTIFRMYERNIGVLTPLIVEELEEAERTYPASWIEEAFKEAAVLNKRSWRYVARILERWATEGKDDGTPKRYPKAPIDPDDPSKYWKGRYGHLAKS